MRSLAPAVIVYHTRLNGRKFSVPNGEAYPFFRAESSGRLSLPLKGR